MNIQKLNEIRLVVINHAIEYALKKGWPYEFEEMMAVASEKLVVLSSRNTYRLLPEDKQKLTSLVAEDFRNWINMNDPTLR